MKQLVIENGLPIPIFIKVEMTPRTDEETGKEIVEAALYFERPECDEPELHIREVATMEQYTFDLPGDPLVELNVGDLGQCVNFGVAENHEMLLVRLAGFKPARN